MASKAGRVFLLSLLVSSLVCYCFAFDPSTYPYNKQLMPKYTAYWRVDQSTLYLALRVQTIGWVGFGIAEYGSGSMPGADIVTGSVVNGNGTITDRWSSDFVLPEVDNCQDWILVAAIENNGYTTLEVKRPLDTKDPQDRVITPGPNRIIVAYGTTDAVSYHSSNRMTSEITFFGDVVEPPLPSNVQYLDLVMGNFLVPNGETEYGCVAFTLPSDKKYHIVQIDPIIQPENEGRVHHFLANVCVNVTDGVLSRFPKALSCAPTETSTDGCSGLVAGWAAGGGSAYMPPEAGLPIGIDGAQIIMLQMHYNNPDGLGGYTDNSGFRIWYTSELRKYDAGILTLGDPFVGWSRDKTKLIPPLAITEYEAECPSACTAKFPHEIYLFQTSPHMHQKGYEFWTTQWRNGTMIGEIGRIEFWSFNHQNLNPLINVTIQPGDRLNTHCVYNTMDITTTTQFGFGSSDEMCMHFVGYYPRIVSPIQLEYCGYAAPGYSACGNDNRSLIMPYNNPTVKDPPGGINRTFGVPEKTCPNKLPTSTTPSPATSVVVPFLFLLSLLSFLL